MDYRLYDAHKAIKRAGHNCLYKLFHNSNIMSGEDALQVFNTFGIPLPIIILIANSHGYSVDEAEFNRLHEIQKERMKNCKQCDSQNMEQP